MSNLIGIPSADYYETRLANMWNGTNGTVYVEKVPEGSMPISEYSYIVVNPGEVNMQVAKIDGWDSENDTFNVIDVAIPSGAGTYYNAKNHPVGSVVRFSNNYAFWKDIQEAINGKLDITSLAPVAVSNDYNDLDNKPTIPTDNCQLCNGCGYITGITCEEVEDALGYTPYDSTNPDGYTTCIGTVTNDDLQSYVKCSDIPDLSEVAKCCDIPTDNCQLSNGCGYTTCTGTLQACDIADLAHCCDIPTNNCELINGCGYITGISCGDVTTALGYSPADSSNLGTASSCNIGTSCGNVPVLGVDGKLSENVIPSVAITDTYEVANKSDLLSLSAQRGDVGIVSSENKSYILGGIGEPSVESNWKLLKTPTDAVLSVNGQTGAVCINVPTDNSELANGCGYTTCTGTVVAGDLAPYAKCCELGTVAFSNKYCDLSGQPTIPTDNCQLGNSCGYTTCTGTLTSADIAGLAQCCDLAGKQDTLTAGNNISINSNTISGNFNYGTSSTAAACTTKCVCIPEITQLCTGQQITVMPSVTATNCATSLKLNDFTAYPIRYMNAALTSTTDGYVWGANCLATFVFDGTYWHVVSKSYDTNTTYTLNTLIDAGKKTAGSGTYALSRYSLVMEKGDGTWEKITNTAAAYSTATTKTVNTSGFRLNKIRYYNTTTNVANGALIATNTLVNQAASVDLRYSTNCGGTTTWAEGDYIYLVGTIKTDGLFYLDTTQWWTNALPTTNDGKLYIRIGIALAAAGYTASLLVDRPVFYYDNGIKIYQQADNKQDKSAMVTTLTGADNDHYPTAKAVSDAIQGAGAGDMLASVYDPCSCNTDAFDYCNFHNIPTIPTDNCQLANSCGFTTCTGTLQACDITNLAQCCDIPTNNNQLSNGCGYTTCTGTLVASDLTPYAKSCDLKAVATSGKYCDLTGTPTIPTNNNQLTNGCGYTTCTGTVSSCADIISKLGYTPYSNANPCGYTTCTGTLTASDLTGYAKSCDLKAVATSGKYCDLTGTPTIPTDNCQLTNGCGYTTCTGTLNGGDLVTINGCCLIGSGDICIQGGSSAITADILVVGGGGAGGAAYGCTGGGGGGGGVIELHNFLLSNNSYCVVVGSGGARVYNGNGGNGSDSCFGTITAAGGCGGIGNGSGGTSGNGYWGTGSDRYLAGGAGGGSNGPGCGISGCTGGTGGPGCISFISGSMQKYAGGGSGGGCKANGNAIDGGGTGTNGDATGCGGGGGGKGGGCGGCGGNGGNGVVIVRYGQNGECGINCATGGTIYCCNGYVIHCFTSNGTFSIIS